MDEEEGFLRAICDQPDEDTPRLAFADWLDEQGGSVNTAWAEVIRVQIALARGSDTEQEQLVARERELERHVGDRWPHRLGLKHPLATRLTWKSWQRGLPLALRVYYPGAEISQLTSAPLIPLRGVELVGVSGYELRTFLKWLALRHVSDLTFYGEGASNVAAVFALAECPYLSNLERLRIGRTALSDPVAIALLDSPHLIRVKDLRMDARLFSQLSDGVAKRLRERFGENWDTF